MDSLVCYAMNTGLAEPCDHTCLTNQLLAALGLDEYTPSDEVLTEGRTAFLRFVNEVNK